jgi:GntR family transcriptional regulator
MTDTLPVGATVGLPLYRRIQADLRGRVERGDLAPGSRIATEQELMTQYAVSRATIRQALGGLIAEDLLEIRRGLGTYVRTRPLEHVMGGFYTFSREIEAHGMTPGTRALSVGIEPADDRVAAVLGVATGTPVVALSRLRLADDQPVVAETSWLPATRFPGLERFDFGQVRLYDTLITRYGVRPVRAHEAFEPVLLSAAEADLLDRGRGDPALRVERTAFDADGAVVEYCRSTVRSDRYRYSVELREP